MQDAFSGLYHLLFDVTLVTSPVYLILAAMVAWLVYRVQNAPSGFWRWLLPARIWRHLSHLIDIQLFLISRLMVALGLIGTLTVTT